MIVIFIRYIGGSIIRNVTINISDEKDLEFVQALESLGMKRTVACVITFLKDLKERLRKRGWLTEHEIKSHGKGRPLKIYALRATIDEIISYYEAEKNRESARTSEAIQRLKMLSSAN